MTSPRPAQLSGFNASAVRFLTNLAQDNSKEFFDAHRDEYDRAVRQPLEDFLAAAEAVYGPGKVMRPNRDIRFSANKDPYRTDASMWAGRVGGVYLNLNTERLEVGGGLYGPARDQLERARTTLADDDVVASQLAAIVDGLRTEGFELAGPTLKTAPRGFDPTHPHIELLRLQHFAAVRTLPIDAAPDQILQTWRLVEPLIEWVDTHIGATTALR